MLPVRLAALRRDAPIAKPDAAHIVQLTDATTIAYRLLCRREKRNCSVYFGKAGWFLTITKICPLQDSFIPWLPKTSSE
jgi:hypothetical protein